MLDDCDDVMLVLFKNVKLNKENKLNLVSRMMISDKIFSQIKILNWND